MFEYVGMFVSLCVLINPSGEMTSGFANVTGITTRTSKLIYHLSLFMLSKNIQLREMHHHFAAIDTRNMLAQCIIIAKYVVINQ